MKKFIYKNCVNEEQLIKNGVDAFGSVFKPYILGMQEIYQGGALIGYIGLCEYEEGCSCGLGVYNFFILPEYRNQGFGSAVLRDVIKKYKKKYFLIYGFVDSSNDRAIDFYNRIGRVDFDKLGENGYYTVLYERYKKKL